MANTTIIPANFGPRGQEILKMAGMADVNPGLDLQKGADETLKYVDTYRPSLSQHHFFGTKDEIDAYLQQQALTKMSKIGKFQ